MESWDYAIVGAGPAGALAAATLARRGRAVALFHWAPRAEKPCGGGVPARGMASFGALLDGVPRNEARAIRVVLPGAEAQVELAQPLAIFARREMDEALRRHAVRAGARRIDARVVAIEPREPFGGGHGGFDLSIREHADGAIRRVAARFVVAADGAAGLARRRLLELAKAPLPGPEQFSRSFTIYPRHDEPSQPRERSHASAPRRDPSFLEIGYARAIDGYGWIFPRGDHASIGWCVQGARESRRPPEFAAYGESGVGALIPSFRAGVARSCVVEGRGFALVGDAAGAVDPITREGIHHAMASGAAIGECDPLARPGSYAAWFDATLRPELVRAAELAPTFFGPRFLATMIGALDRSEALRAVFRDLVAGTQSYATLKRRLLRSLPRTLPALALAALRSR